MLVDDPFSPLSSNGYAGAGDVEAAGDIDSSVTAGKGDMAYEASGVRNTLRAGLRCQFRQG
jgi:hypothetical protein